VHVYVDGALAGGTLANRSRTDVGAVFPASGPNHGFDATFAATPGPHNVCTYAINDGPPDHTPLGCRPVTVIARNAPAPFGSLDVVARSGSTVRVAGWAIDPDTNDPIAVHVYVGPSGTATQADRSRTDVDAILHRGEQHGFEVVLPIPSGATSVCAYAINNLAGGVNTLLGCRTV